MILSALSLLKLPVALMRVAALISVVLTAFFPNVSDTTKLIVIVSVLAVYMVLEVVVHSLRAHKLELPAISASDAEGILNLLKSTPKTEKLVSDTEVAATRALNLSALPSDPIVGEHAVHDDSATALARAKALLAQAEARSASN